MTAPSDAVMSFSYDPLQVGLSVLLAIAASYAALDLAGRVMAKRKGVRATFLRKPENSHERSLGRCFRDR